MDAWSRKQGDMPAGSKSRHKWISYSANVTIRVAVGARSRKPQDSFTTTSCDLNVLASVQRHGRDTHTTTCHMPVVYMTVHEQRVAKYACSSGGSGINLHSWPGVSVRPPVLALAVAPMMLDRYKPKFGQSRLLLWMCHRAVSMRSYGRASLGLCQDAHCGLAAASRKDN